MDPSLYGLRHAYRCHRHKLASPYACTSTEIGISCRLESIYRDTIHLFCHWFLSYLLGRVLCILLRKCLSVLTSICTVPLTQSKRLTGTVIHLPVSRPPIQSPFCSPPMVSVYPGEYCPDSSHRDGAAHLIRRSQRRPWSPSSYIAGLVSGTLTADSTCLPLFTGSSPLPSSLSLRSLSPRSRMTSARSVPGWGWFSA